jgi:DNA-binding NtrC family response regulator
LNHPLLKVTHYSNRLKRDKEEREKLKKQREQEALMNQNKKPLASKNEFVQKILNDSAPLTSSKIEEMIHGSGGSGAGAMGSDQN